MTPKVFTGKSAMKKLRPFVGSVLTAITQEDSLSITLAFVDDSELTVCILEDDAGEATIGIEIYRAKAN